MTLLLGTRPVLKDLLLACLLSYSRVHAHTTATYTTTVQYRSALLHDPENQRNRSMSESQFENPGFEATDVSNALGWWFVNCFAQVCQVYQEERS